MRFPYDSSEVECFCSSEWSPFGAEIMSAAALTRYGSNMSR